MALTSARPEPPTSRRFDRTTDKIGKADARFGTTVLAGSAWSSYHHIRNAISSGDGGSSDGGGRSGCGGGGCGGCAR